MKNISFQEEKRNIRDSIRNIASWRPATPQSVKALVFIAHGFIEHSLSYSLLAERLALQGYAVFAIDHIGHGLSEGKRGIIPDYQILYQDFIQFINDIRQEYPSALPCFLFCHSMGGLIGIKSINKIHSSITAVIFSSAAVISGPGSAAPFGIRFLYPLSRTYTAGVFLDLLSKVDPDSPTAPILAEDITSDPNEIEEMSRDPRRAGSFVPNKTAAEMIKFMKAAKNEIPFIKVPFMCIHGTKDEVTYKEGSEYIYNHAATDKRDGDYSLSKEPNMNVFMKENQ